MDANLAIRRQSLAESSGILQAQKHRLTWATNCIWMSRLRNVPSSISGVDQYRQFLRLNNSDLLSIGLVLRQMDLQISTRLSGVGVGDRQETLVVWLNAMHRRLRQALSLVERLVRECEKQLGQLEDLVRRHGLTLRRLRIISGPVADIASGLEALGREQDEEEEAEEEEETDKEDE